MKHRFNRNDWPTIKAEGLKDRSLLYGQVPRLHIDGMDLVETGAIMRYIGRKYFLLLTTIHNCRYNLLGETPETNAFGDMAYEGFVDCLNGYFKAVFSPNPEDKVNYYSKTLETFLSAFEYVFGKYEGPFILGEKPTMYDCMAYSVLDIVLTNAPSPISNPVIEKFMVCRLFGAYADVCRMLSRMFLLSRTLLNPAEESKCFAKCFELDVVLFVNEYKINQKRLYGDELRTIVIVLMLKISSLVGHRMNELF